MDQPALNLSDNLGMTRSAAADALSREIMQHEDENKNRSYLSRLIVGVTEVFHGEDKSLAHLNNLQNSILLAKEAGDPKFAIDPKLATEAQSQTDSVIAQDKEARSSANSWSANISNFTMSAGLFFPGKAGYALAAFTNAADSAHPADSMTHQGLDVLLGASKGAALKLTFDKVGQSEMNIALKAGTLSISNRLAEVGLNSHTYIDDKTGNASVTDGLWKTAKTVADPYQLGMDLATFGGGYLLLNKMGISPEFARSNPMIAQAMTGAGFGFSSGFFSDLQNQQKLGNGDHIDLGSALKNGFVQMGLDGAAASIGGFRMQQMLSAARPVESFGPQRAQASGPPGLDMSHIAGIYGFDKRPVARIREPLSTPFALVDATKPSSASSTLAPQRELSPGVKEFHTDTDVSQLLSGLRAQGLNAKALLNVREILSDGKSSGDPALGPEKTLLIQHIEPGTKLAPEANSADILATCNPELLKTLGLKDVDSRHLFPEANDGGITLQVPGSNRLRFSLADATNETGSANDSSLMLGRPPARPLGIENPYEPFVKGPHTVSDLLRGLTINDNISNVHSIDGRLGVDEIADAMSKVKMPVEKIIGGGGDSIAFKMTDGKILKLTDRPWDPDWGARTLTWRDQQVRFDAHILGKPQQIRVGDQTITYYVQQDGITPVSKADTRYFDGLLDADGKFVFWDQSKKDLVHGPDQLAYVPLQQFKSGLLTAIPVPEPSTGRLTRGLALIDYDAVRLPGDVPQFESGGSWDYARYDFSPVDRR